MTTASEYRDVPYSPERMFALVADIESYPGFLPEYAAARVERQDGNTLRVRQIVNVAGRRLDFVTAARLHPPEAIEITGIEGPFRELSISWSFRPLEHGGCRIGYRMHFETGSRLLALLAGPILASLARRTLAAFECRARELYGRAGEGEFSA